MSEKEASLPTRRILSNQCSSKDAANAQDHHTIYVVNSHLAHLLQHSTTLRKHEYKKLF